MLRLDGHEAMASQRYLLTFRGAVVQVYFRNGSFFHEFELRAGGYTAIYQCGTDRYIGRYRLLDPDVWSLTWCVRGPSKNYDIRTLYRRASRASAD
jgi:hypothetical protein